MTPIALTIAGSDPSGGAGIQADLKTFYRFGVYGEAVITLLTVQNTRGVTRVEVLKPDLIVQQARAVIEDLQPAAAKTGALGNADVVEAIARECETWPFPLVVDPVMISKHGAPLMSGEAREAMRDLLLPKAALITPNVHEAEALTGVAIETPAAMRRAAEHIALKGARAVLIKGGHLNGPDSTDILWINGDVHEWSATRIDTPHTHGTGCTFSAAITAQIARGVELHEAVGVAKDFISRAIATAPGIGGGNGPVNHHA